MVRSRASVSLLSFWHLFLAPSLGNSLPVAEVLSEVAAATSLPYNFTLAAYNVTLLNTDRNGIPLVLGQNGMLRHLVQIVADKLTYTLGATSGITSHVTSVRPSLMRLQYVHYFV
jgi:hypothetical protein